MAEVARSSAGVEIARVALITGKTQTPYTRVIEKVQELALTLLLLRQLVILPNDNGDNSTVVRRPSYCRPIASYRSCGRRHVSMPTSYYIAELEGAQRVHISA